MRILLLGNKGQLGWEAERELACLGELIALDYPEVDFTKPESLPRLVDETKPDLIFNAVAYTAVDKAEKEAENAHSINAVAPGELAEAARKRHAVLIHFSTDYVFDGSKSSPYIETDSVHPLNYYGQSKLEGEQAALQVGGSVLVLRTSWVYSRRKDSFVTKVLQWARKQNVLRVVADQVGNPTWARMLAEISAQMISRSGERPFETFAGSSGLYHLAGSGYTSRYEWARAILDLDPLREEQIVQSLEIASSDEFVTPAKRPLFNALNCDLFTRVFGLSLPDWRKTLALAIENNSGGGQP